jgi:hypothetical protein
MNTDVLNTKIYKDRSEVPRQDGLPRWDPPSWDMIRTDACLFRPEFLERVHSETKWIDVLGQEVAPIPQEKHAAIGLDREECPRCGGRRGYHVDKRGADTGVIVTFRQACVCCALRRFWSRWDKTPQRFRNVTPLRYLEPSEKSLLPIEKQQEIIDSLRKDPTRSYLLYGQAGTGKTHIASSLYRHHLAAWALIDNLNWTYCSVWRVSAPVLLEQWVAKSIDKTAPKPEVSESMIRNVAKDGQRPVLFLDEIDKVNGSDYKMEKLRAIVDAVYEAQGQIVATSNADPAAIAARWGGEWGDVILRRIAAPPEGLAIEFGAA